MKTTIRNSHLARPLSIDDLQNESYFACYFATVADADKFLSTIPKFVKAYKQGLQTLLPNDDENYGLIFIPQGPNYASAPAVRLRISDINGTTGVANETGIRRRNRFIDAIRQTCEVVSSLE